MLIEIHMIQNHSPSNLNRDDLGAPKTCYFGGVLRSRISSQCLKRSIRMSDEFKLLLGGIRTRQLAKLITDAIKGDAKVRKLAVKILKDCGISANDDGKSDMLVYTSNDAIQKMSVLLQNNEKYSEDQLTIEFGNIISELTSVPDMALSGRMLETGKLKNTTVEASLQVAHAISTHEARPEVDYYIAADDIPGDDAGAGFIDETMFGSACFYKYFSIHWEQLVENLKGFGEDHQKLAAHTVGAFIRGAALINPTGKQNSYAANNHPDGILIEIRNGTPINYANAFAKPASQGERDLIQQSIAQLGQYIFDLDVGYGKPEHRFWFSPNLHYPLNVRIKDDNEKEKEMPISANNLKSLDELIPAVMDAFGFDWEEVKEVTVNSKESS